MKEIGRISSLLLSTTAEAFVSQRRSNYRQSIADGAGADKKRPNFTSVGHVGTLFAISEEQAKQQLEQGGHGAPSKKAYNNGEINLSLPRHSYEEDVNKVLEMSESFLSDIYSVSAMEAAEVIMPDCQKDAPQACASEQVFANSYVDLGRVDTVGFDYDYTLVTYTDELLEMIYDMSKERLVEKNSYPKEILDELKFDKNFSIRGLAVDRETGWICQLSYTHKVAVAWEGREKVSRERLMQQYTGKRSLTPTERKKRLKPLNDLFSMAECCLMADVIQFFKGRNIPFHARSVVNDILSAIGSTHISGNFHRIVAENPSIYFEPKPHLAGVLRTLKKSGKRLIFVSNSPFWYVDAGMKYVVGENWRDEWDVVIASAGKPLFYTDGQRPFREVSVNTGRIKFKKIDQLQRGNVYTEGCLKELVRCIDWDITHAQDSSNGISAGLAETSLASPNVLYIGDSLFADLVDAKREFGWTTAAVTPEVGWELEKTKQVEYLATHRTIDLLLHTIRQVQSTLGNNARSVEDNLLLDQLESLVSKWRDRQQNLMGNPFGSIFRARHQPSLFAHSIKRYCDLYMRSIADLRHYSPQHRFYPEDSRSLSHELRTTDFECWDFEI